MHLLHFAVAARELRFIIKKVCVRVCVYACVSVTVLYMCACLGDCDQLVIF